MLLYLATAGFIYSEQPSLSSPGRPELRKQGYSEKVTLDLNTKCFTYGAVPRSRELFSGHHQNQNRREPRQTSRQVSESHDAKGPFQDLDHNTAEKIQEGSRHTG